MPELPEVETVRRGLAPAMEGRVIARAEIRRPDLRWPFPERMAERLEGARIGHLGRRSKYLLVTLDRGETLIVHLGMSGRMLVEGAPTAGYVHEHAAPEKHDHVVLHLDDGARITFNDPRRFGAMDLAPSDTIDSHWLLAKLGPEPLGNGFDESHLVTAFRGRNTPVKSALLDQKIVAGLGNIYVCEALHLAGISPMRKAGRIAVPRVRALVPAIRETLARAIEAGGSSLRDYRQADGALGYFQHNFRVYDREGRPCVTPGCPGTIRRIVQSGRSSFYCATCQR
ncbi:DNA-(apurinic or apyrimidinic site) lyase [Palleronia marisminoris]|uniref:Formamidopyrimidine-DNA glycosylase n=1 Tax=Palleronia marisminoris TaxID=315423 RepID=A0A1Y5SSE8_9RHOB|nr:bifunctional DNA-formamidopyrimidine glycosylase/DNA-(apurinic or apyrimidinic site) lyase [Palleronia marisminoris]SFG94958.1 DNA-(apurinic or apyrimidinic site) lyase [Palleronia marisminoris]SLN46694.1 Formamidopyrimidine-DNA glycosylase [Palleronia marisminoris]